MEQNGTSSHNNSPLIKSTKGHTLRRSEAIVSDDEVVAAPSHLETLQKNNGEDERDGGGGGEDRGVEEEISTTIINEGEKIGDEDVNSPLNLLSFIKETINKNIKDRNLLLRTEAELSQFIASESPSLPLPGPYSSYQRLLIHRVAAYFGLEHNVDRSGSGLLISRPPTPPHTNNITSNTSNNTSSNNTSCNTSSNNTSSSNTSSNTSNSTSSSTRVKFRDLISSSVSGDEGSTTSGSQGKIHQYSRTHSGREWRGASHRILKVASFESSPSPSRPPPPHVAKAYSFGGYGRTSAQPPPPHPKAPPLSGGRSLSPGSSGYKSVSFPSMELRTPSPAGPYYSPTEDSSETSPSSASHHTNINNLNGINGMSASNLQLSGGGGGGGETNESLVLWAVSDIKSVPPGAILIDPNTLSRVGGVLGTPSPSTPYPTYYNYIDGGGGGGGGVPIAGLPLGGGVNGGGAYYPFVHTAPYYTPPPPHSHHPLTTPSIGGGGGGGGVGEAAHWLGRLSLGQGTGGIYSAPQPQAPTPNAHVYGGYGSQGGGGSGGGAAELGGQAVYYPQYGYYGRSSSVSTPGVPLRLFYTGGGGGANYVTSSPYIITSPSPHHPHHTSLDQTQIPNPGLNGAGDAYGASCYSYPNTNTRYFSPSGGPPSSYSSYSPIYQSSFPSQLPPSAGTYLPHHHHHPTLAYNYQPRKNKRN